MLKGTGSSCGLTSLRIRAAFSASSFCQSSVIHQPPVCQCVKTRLSSYRDWPPKKSPNAVILWITGGQAARAKREKSRGEKPGGQFAVYESVHTVRTPELKN